MIIMIIFLTKVLKVPKTKKNRYFPKKIKEKRIIIIKKMFAVNFDIVKIKNNLNK